MDGIAALITSVAAFVAATGSWINSRRTAREVTPNHGSSMRDSTTRTEKAMDTLLERSEAQGREIRSLGHQVGEMRDDARTVHEDLAGRIRNLERRL